MSRVAIDVEFRDDTFMVTADLHAAAAIVRVNGATVQIANGQGALFAPTTTWCRYDIAEIVAVACRFRHPYWAWPDTTPPDWRSRHLTDAWCQMGYDIRPEPVGDEA